MMKRKIYLYSFGYSVIGIGLLLFLATGFQKSDIVIHNSIKNRIIESVVTDIDGNIYHPIKIGKQVWLRENLKVTHYRDSTPIPQVSDEEIWSVLTTGAYCLNENDPEIYKQTYGVLYNYYTVTDARNICPEGWHVPDKDEWFELENYLGGQSIAGGKMKDVKSNLWPENSNANNKSGFSALPAGGRGRLGKPGDVGFYATWWSSTSHDSLYAWHWGLYPDRNSTRRNPGHKASGFSIRCVKD